MVEKIRKSSKSEQPIIGLDFDGTLFGHPGKQFPGTGEANWDVIETAKTCQGYGAKLVLWTCRSGNELSMALVAAKKVGLQFDGVNENVGWDPGSPKIYATIYVDDRSPGSIDYFINNFINDFYGY